MTVYNEMTIEFNEYSTSYLKMTRYIEENEPLTKEEKESVISNIINMLKESSERISYDNKIHLITDFAIAANDHFYSVGRENDSKWITYTADFERYKNYYVAVEKRYKNNLPQTEEEKESVISDIIDTLNNPENKLCYDDKIQLLMAFSIILDISLCF